MHAKTLKMLILQAIGGSLATGCLAAAGCNHARDARVADAGDDTTSDASKGGDGGHGGAGHDAGKGGKGVPVAGFGGGEVLPMNCHRTPGVGTCCDTLACFPRDPRADDAGADDEDDAGAAPRVACPSTRPSLGVCSFYSPLKMETDDECCYTHTQGSCCGRPFVIAGESRAARLRPSTDWISAPVDSAMAIDDATRAALAHAWLADASLEHASIASFARFTLQALSLGAPAELLADVQLAALDEITHARLCFDLASRYAQTPIGPGVFEMDGACGAVTLAEAAAATVREGCVGETLGAFVAQAQLARATDPGVRAALATIAADEARHAELAWRFVAWALNQGDESVRSAVEAAWSESLARVHADAARAQPTVDVAVWHEHGRLTASEERACWMEAARELIEPCMSTLLARS